MPPRARVFGIAAILLLAAASELGSENVTLTTYYPAPSGVYARMIITGSTFLARDGGNVGIGTTNPQAQLHVASPDDAGTTVIVQGFGNQGQIYNDGNMRIESSGGPLWLNQKTGNNVLIAAGIGPGNVGIGTNNPQAPAPNGLPGNLDLNDVYLRRVSAWSSDLLTAPASMSYVGTFDVSGICIPGITCMGMKCNRGERVIIMSGSPYYSLSACDSLGNGTSDVNVVCAGLVWGLQFTCFR